MYKCNVTDGIEIGMNDTEIGHERASMLIRERQHIRLECSFEEEVDYRFPEFLAKTDMRNPQFDVGQLFWSMQDFRIVVRAYGATNGYNVKFDGNAV